ncbi:MAG: hypothetical protein HC809_15690 [Gammaproteobacteria bacterium]|nr:hypothetical protein [Gammaproteobacteria bacterium]
MGVGIAVENDGRLVVPRGDELVAHLGHATEQTFDGLGIEGDVEVE